MAVHLTLSTPERVHDAIAVVGYCATIQVDGCDISKYVTDVQLNCPADGPVTAKVTMCVSNIDIDAPIDIEFVRAHCESMKPHPVLGGNAQIAHR